MGFTRKQFLDLASKGALGAYASSIFDFLPRAPALQAADIISSPELRKVGEYIASHREEHVANVQRDLRQPSVSSWKKGVWEMAQVM
ncbi:MAG: hypothetical protein DMG10_03935, partial [Acidobacteria bacterium]